MAKEASTVLHVVCVARGLRVEGIEERFGTVKVSVADVRVEHQVKITDFMKWLERPGRTPREITQRLRIRSILVTSVSR